VVNPDSFLEKPFTAEQARIVLLQCPALRAFSATVTAARVFTRA
jgi:hypothetical protein